MLPNGDVTYKEWAPGAKSISLFGDFNDWNREQHQAVRDEFGCWNLTLKAVEKGVPLIKHEMRYKVAVEYPDGEKVDKNPAWSNYQV